MTKLEHKFKLALETNNFITTKREPKFYRMIAKHFKEVTEWFDGCVVHHKDGNPCNNHPSNLQCLTIKDHNLLHNYSRKSINRELNRLLNS